MKTTKSILWILVLLLIFTGCSRKPVEVTLDADNGTAPVVVQVEKGSTLGEPTEPTKEGYDFVCWTEDKETVAPAAPYDFSTPVQEDLCLEATYQESHFYTTKKNHGGMDGAGTQLTLPELSGNDTVCWFAVGSGEDAEKMPIYTFKTLPAGLELFSTSEHPDGRDEIYHRRGSEYPSLLFLQYWQVGSKRLVELNVADENSRENVSVQGKTAYFYDNPQPGKCASVIWLDQEKNLVFVLRSNLGKDVLLAAAENLEFTGYQKDPEEPVIPPSSIVDENGNYIFTDRDYPLCIEHPYPDANELMETHTAEELRLTAKTPSDQEIAEFYARAISVMNAVYFCDWPTGPDSSPWYRDGSFWAFDDYMDLSPCFASGEDFVQKIGAFFGEERAGKFIGFDNNYMVFDGKIYGSMRGKGSWYELTNPRIGEIRREDGCIEITELYDLYEDETLSKKLGTFAQVNTMVYRDGHWYFTALEDIINGYSIYE